MVDDRTVPLDWHHEALEQLTRHWEGHVRPRLEGLTDDELHWEPVPGCWGVRPRAEATTSHAEGVGDRVIDWEEPQPEPPPVTTIAWRLWHIVEDVFGGRVRAHFEDGPPGDHTVVDHGLDAAGTLAALDDAYQRWVDGVRALGPDGMDQACGPHEGVYGDHPFAALVLHIHREAIHHGAEVLTLRDLYRAAGGRPLADRPRRDPEPIGFQVTFDAIDPHAQARFWAAALHYEVEDTDALVGRLLAAGVLPEEAAIEIDGLRYFRTVVAIRPPAASDAEADDNRRILFNAVPEPRTGKNRVHLDLRALGRDRGEDATERLEAEVVRLEGLGATVLYRHDEPDGRWVTMADPEGNELCVG